MDYLSKELDRVMCGIFSSGIPIGLRKNAWLERRNRELKIMSEKQQISLLGANICCNLNYFISLGALFRRCKTELHCLSFLIL